MPKLGYAKPCFESTEPTEPSNSSLLEAALKRDRALVIAGLGAVTLLAWAYIFYLARGMAEMGETSGMGGMDGMEMTGARLLMAWGPVDFALMFLMWAVMMAAMMVPSAAPMILTFAAVNRRRAVSGRNSGGPIVPIAFP